MFLNYECLDTHLTSFFQTLEEQDVIPFMQAICIPLLDIRQSSMLILTSTDRTYIYCLFFTFKLLNFPLKLDVFLLLANHTSQLHLRLPLHTNITILLNATQVYIHMLIKSCKSSSRNRCNCN